MMDVSDPPYTLSASKAFLLRAHRLSILEFLAAVKVYEHAYTAYCFNSCGSANLDVTQQWNEMMDLYVKVGSPQDLSLSPMQRDYLVFLQASVVPPTPDRLKHSIDELWLVLAGLLLSFCEEIEYSMCTSERTSSSSRLESS